MANKAKETDFLIIKDDKPWLLLETVLKRSTIDYHHKKHRESLGKDIPFIQDSQRNQNCRETGQTPISNIRL